MWRLAMPVLISLSLSLVCRFLPLVPVIFLRSCCKSPALLVRQMLLVQLPRRSASSLVSELYFRGPTYSMIRSPRRRVKKFDVVGRVHQRVVSPLSFSVAFPMSVTQILLPRPMQCANSRASSSTYRHGQSLRGMDGEAKQSGEAIASSLNRIHACETLDRFLSRHPLASRFFPLIDGIKVPCPAPWSLFPGRCCCGASSFERYDYGAAVSIAT
jgi:hypothetical protein